MEQLRSDIDVEPQKLLIDVKVTEPY
jgi:hypothetical protein